MEENENWVYYLKLQKELTPEFLTLDHKLKENGKSLIPVTLNTLLEIVKNKRSVHILMVVKSVGEYNYFKRKVKKILKYLIRTGKVHLYVASSFSGVNDTAIMRRDYYNFVKLPVSYHYLTTSISNMIDIHELGVQTWPGGIRSSFQVAG